MKIVLWIGNQPNQKALANKIHAAFPLTGIITETRDRKRKRSVSIMFKKTVEKLFLSTIGKTWQGLQQYYTKQYPDYPTTALLNVENINSGEAYDFTKELDPDLIIVSGTRLVKEKMLTINPKTRILNLHTGLSPYIKGGPNCTNWCIATKQFHLIGNTIMWIDAGIDTGNILTTAFTEFDGAESLPDIHIKVMEHAHSLYLKAIEHVSKGGNSNVKQNDITAGTTYYTKQWGLKEKIKLLKNVKRFRNAVTSGEIDKRRASIKTINI